MKRSIVLALIISLILGCVSMGRKLDESAVDKIKEGETTKEQVLSLIGSPDQVTRFGGDTTFMYRYVRATPKAVNFVPVVGAFAGGANVQNQMLMLTFGSDNICKHIFSTYGASESDRGLSTGSKANMNDVEENKRPK